jgi:hypothetical protein
MTTILEIRRFQLCCNDNGFLAGNTPEERAELT